MTVGDRVESRTSPPPQLTEEEQAARRAKAEALAPKYRTEFLRPRGLAHRADAGFAASAVPRPILRAYT